MEKSDKIAQAKLWAWKKLKIMQKQVKMPKIVQKNENILKARAKTKN